MGSELTNKLLFGASIKQNSAQAIAQVTNLPNIDSVTSEEGLTGGSRMANCQAMMKTTGAAINL